MIQLETGAEDSSWEAVETRESIPRTACVRLVETLPADDSWIFLMTRAPPCEGKPQRPTKTITSGSTTLMERAIFPMAIDDLASIADRSMQSARNSRSCSIFSARKARQERTSLLI